MFEALKQRRRQREIEHLIRKLEAHKANLLLGANILESEAAKMVDGEYKDYTLAEAAASRIYAQIITDQLSLTIPVYKTLLAVKTALAVQETSMAIQERTEST